MITFISKKSGRKCVFQHSRGYRNEMKVVLIQDEVSNTSNHAILNTVTYDIQVTVMQVL